MHRCQRKRQTRCEAGTQSHGALAASRATERLESTAMTVRTHAPRQGSRRLTSRRFPSALRARESAIAWLASDPVFAEVTAARS